MSDPLGVGVIGAGNISDVYLETLTRSPDVAMVAVADLDTSRARAQAERHGVARSGSVEELLGSDDVDIVVNLTIPAAHTEVGTAALEAGKHVWSEKPFALDVASGQRFLEAGRSRGLRTACAPDTILGSGMQTVQRALAEGAIGAPVSALAVMQAPGPERWHPNPEFLYDVGAGPLFDLGPYFLSALVQSLGPVESVRALSAQSRPTRVVGSGPRAGSDFPVRVPTQYSALLRFAGGADATFVISFEAADERVVLEFTGSAGTLRAPDPRYFDGDVVIASDAARTVPATGGIERRGLGVVELARAIRAGVPERASGEFALHVLDVMESITRAAETGETVALRTSTAVPTPLSGEDAAGISASAP